jgi:signal transduction histidine kinase
LTVQGSTDPNYPSGAAAQSRSASATSTLAGLGEDRDSLGMLRAGSAFAILLTAIYLVAQIYYRGPFASGMIFVWLGLIEVGVFYLGLLSRRVLEIWKPWTLCYGTVLIATFAIFGGIARDTEVAFVGALLTPLATAAFVAWGPSWQLALNAASVAIFLIVPNLTNDLSPYRPAQVLGLLAGLAFAQCGAVYIDRYKRRLRQQVIDLEAAARFREAQISAMAHDVRSPAAALSGYAALLQTDDLSPDEQKGLIARLGATAWNMDLVVSNLLDMYQIHERRLTVAPAQIDLNARLAEMAESCAMQAQRRGVEFIRELHPLPPCRQDPRHIERIVKNLAGFAIDRGNSSPVRIVCRQHENQIRIEVVDFGLELSQAELAAHLAPVESNGIPSSSRGLNLYIARALTSASGGIFDVRRNAGGGLTLLAELPIEGQPAPRVPG